MPSRGRGKTSRARARKAAAVELEKPEEPEVHAEKIPNSPPGAGDIQSEVPMSTRSPAQVCEKFEGLDPDSEHGEKDSDSDADPVPPSQAHAISSDSQSCQDDSPLGSQKSKKSSKSQGDPSQTSPATKKNKKSAGSNRERQDYKKAIKNDPQIEKDLVEFYKSNPSLWDLRQEDNHNRDIKKKLLVDISKTTGVSVNNIVGWWKGMRDTYTRLSQKKSGEERDNLPYKQKWVLDNLAFLRERPVQRRAPIKSLQELAEDNPRDLDAVEREAARQGKANDGSTWKGTGKGKSKNKSGEADEDADILALQQTAKDSVSVLESLKESINKVAAKRDEPSDVATLYGQYVTHEMRQMSKRRFKLFRREVEESLAKYNSSTDSEDDDSTPRHKKPSTVTTTDTYSSSSRMASSSYGSSSYTSGMQQSGGDGWQLPPSRWIPNPPDAASPWHSQDNRYMQQYIQQQRMPAIQKQLTSQMQPTLQSPNRPSLRHVSYGQPVQGQADLSQGSLRPLYAVPVTPVTNLDSPLTQALLSSGIDASTLQDNFTQEDVNMSVMTRNLDVLGQEGINMDSSLGGTTRQYLLQFCCLLRMLHPVHGPSHHVVSEVPRDFVTEIL